jgi:hypothetical protein
VRTTIVGKYTTFKEIIKVILRNVILISLLILFFPLLSCWVGVHCGIYKGSCNMSNISYLNSPPPLLSFISLSPVCWNNINNYHFCIYMHVYTFFAANSSSYLLSPPSPPSHGCYSSLPPVLSSCSLIL